MLLFVVYYAAVNLLAYAMFAMDKRRAVNGGWRISESNLLAVMVFGGSIGGLVASHQLRHKTRKEPFRTFMFVILLVQGVALFAGSFVAAIMLSPPH